MPNISIIVLAYNDAESLKELVPRIDSVLSRCSESFEIIVVNDGSSDNTSEVCQGLQKEIKSLRTVNHERNLGVGAAFKTGLQNAKFEIIGYIDGDGQYEPEDIPILLKSLQHADAVSGHRVHRADSIKRKLQSKFYNKLIKLLYHLELEDVNSGLKLYRRSFLPTDQELNSEGPFFDAEIILRGTSSGLKICEVPIRHYPRKHGKALGGSLASTAKTISELGPV